MVSCRYRRLREHPYMEPRGGMGSKMRHAKDMIVHGLLGSVLILILLQSAGPAAAGRHPRLFGAWGENRSSNIHMFPKWTGTLARYFAERKLAQGSCSSRRFNRCHLQRWQAFVKRQRGRSRMAQLRAVNAYANRARYITDPVNYNMPDYWATPRQFLRRNGDCEDYAIVKYLSLRALGMPANSMRILVLVDQNLRLAHAVLIVYLNGTAYVLDNQIGYVVDHRRIYHYRPIYSINEKGWWAHMRVARRRAPRSAPPRSIARPRLRPRDGGPSMIDIINDD